MSKVNEHRKGYKHTSLGWIPEEWEVVNLEEVTDKKRPISYGIVQTGPLVDGGVKCVRVLDLENGKINMDNLITTSEAISNSYKRTILKQNDLVVALRGKIGQLAVADKGMEGCNLTRGVALISPNESYLALFLYQQLTSPLYKRIFEKNLNGSALQELSIGVIRNIPTIVSKNLLEQRQIAVILSTWDEAITKTQQLISQLQHRHKGFAQEVLTGKKRINGFKKKWAKLHISEIAKEVSQKNRDNKELTVLSCTKYDGLVPSLEYFGRRVFGSDISTYKMVPLNHFAYATNHIEEGSIGYQNFITEALISPMYTVFKTNNQVHNEYLYRLLKSHHYIHEYNKRMEGSIDRRGGLRWDEFSKIVIYLPEIEEQIAITSFLNQIEREIELFRQKLTRLQQQKKGLMQKLLTGEIRVKH